MSMVAVSLIQSLRAVFGDVWYRFRVALEEQLRQTDMRFWIVSVTVVVVLWLFFRRRRPTT
jgi:hypothetical protein